MNTGWLDDAGSLPGWASTLLDGVDAVVSDRWILAKRRADDYQGAPEERLDQLRQAVGKELGAVGALSGGVASVPGVGTMTALATSGADLAWYTTRSADIILTVAAIRGHDSTDVEERRMWVLAILGFGGAASAEVARLAGEAGMGLGKRMTVSAPTRLVQRMNSRLAAAMLTRYGSRRGLAALGRVLPFGVGAFIGGTTNYALGRALVHQADRFFSDLASMGDGENSP